MTSANLPAANDADKKQQVWASLTAEEIRVIGMAAVQEGVSRSNLIAEGALEKAVAILTEKMPAALDGTPWAIAKSA